jgi:phosphatidylserine/phosphatidylglycerophosphate/cardiolipin synthase-like enzyme
MESRTKEIQWAWSNPVVQDLLLTYYRDWLFNTPEKAERTVHRRFINNPATKYHHLIILR